jgi:surface protein
MSEMFLIIFMFLVGVVLILIPFINNYIANTSSSSSSSSNIYDSTVCKDKVHALVGLCKEKGQEYCSKSNNCIDLNNDVKNCGTCGNVCLNEKVCSSGVCTQEPFILVYANIQQNMNIILPIVKRFENKPLTIDWGDGNTLNDTTISHIYNQNYSSITIKIFGTNLIQAVRVPVAPVKPVSTGQLLYTNLTKIESFGKNILCSISYRNMVDLISVPPLPSNITDASYMFAGCKSFNQDISNWNTSNIINMSYMFLDCVIFNQRLNNWNVSNVTDMSNMFLRAIMFNQPISIWDTSNVNDMTNMFSGAQNFNQSLNNWKLNNLFTCTGMFCNALKFNKDNISKWSFNFRNAALQCV